MPKVIISNNNRENQIILKRNFIEEQANIWTEYEQIFTDGSVLDKKTGCAFYHKKNKIMKKFKLPDGSSIYSAELWAILESLKYCRDFNENNKFVIFSDSQSSLIKISDCLNIAPANYLISEIANLIDNLRNLKKEVFFVWVRAHIGIPENELVDKAAKEATISGSPTNFKIPYSDIISQVKARMIHTWQEQYANSDKGLAYKNNFPNLVCKRTWFCKESSKNFVRIISRIRSFHALYPKHMKRIGLQTEENCECGETGDLEHYIFKCTRFQNYRNKFFSNLVGLVEIPYNLNYILTLNNTKIYRYLYQFIMETQLKF